ncbi:MAG: uncharacterized protein JWO35_866 [Candidatus Saccharibacteria bacterium]|nr:uncharacterized protein [Candidatus Saccharibacteria bacterium]
MANKIISTKRVAISKANAQMVAVVGAASFITIFSLVASQAVFSTNQYQSRVTAAKDKANKQLQVNTESFSELVGSYEKFDGASKNVIGGSKTGAGDNDGNNAKIVLDALPSSYDFPALTSSLEKILSDRSLKISSITGTDDQVNQEANSSSPNPQAVPMPFTFSISNASYTSVQDLIKKLEHSIRPIQVDSITLSGGSSDMTLTVNAHTYFQPGKSLNITNQVVK